MKGKPSPRPTPVLLGGAGWLPVPATAYPPRGGRCQKGHRVVSARLLTVAASVGNALKGFGRTWGVQQMFQSRRFPFREHRLCNPSYTDWSLNMLRSQNGRVSKEKLQKYPNSDVKKKIFLNV